MKSLGGPVGPGRRLPCIVDDRYWHLEVNMRDVRLRREEKTVAAILRLYCAGVHGTRSGLCDECAELMIYARKRVERCPFGEDKPTCAKCPVHCYRPEMRARIRAVMRYAGPRMLFRHPVLTFFHLVHSWQPAPELPQPVARPSPGAGAK